MPSAEQMETIKVYTTWTLDDPHGSRITELGDTPITVVRADDHAQQVAALRQEIADAKMEVKLLWTALTNEVGAERVFALSEAVLAARKAGKHD